MMMIMIMKRKKEKVMMMKVKHFNPEIGMLWYDAMIALKAGVEVMMGGGKPFSKKTRFLPVPICMHGLNYD